LCWRVPSVGMQRGNTCVSSDCPGRRGRSRNAGEGDTGVGQGVRAQDDRGLCQVTGAVYSVRCPRLQHLLLHLFRCTVQCPCHGGGGGAAQAGAQGRGAEDAAEGSMQAADHSVQLPLLGCAPAGRNPRHGRVRARALLPAARARVQHRHSTEGPLPRPGMCGKALELLCRVRGGEDTGQAAGAAAWDGGCAAVSRGGGTGLQGCLALHRA
jgi:hypothetical protein